MRIKTLAVIVLAAGLLITSRPVTAHHGASGYDNSKLTVLKATITEFVWMNPHSQVKFDAPDANGTVRHWNIEAPPPTMLTERGWTKSSLKAGWVVTMYFNAAQNGSPVGIMRRATLPNGEDLWAYPSQELMEKLTTGPK